MLRFSAAIVLFVGFAGVLAPRTAMASCGDWLAHPTAAAENLNGSDVAGFVQRTSPPPAAPQPCSGPLCKRSPMEQIPSPAAPIKEGVPQEIAWRCVQPSDDVFLEVRFSFEPQFVLPSGNPLGVDRPPQS